MRKIQITFVNAVTKRIMLSNITHHIDGVIIENREWTRDTSWVILPKEVYVSIQDCGLSFTADGKTWVHLRYRDGLSSAGLSTF